MDVTKIKIRSKIMLAIGIMVLMVSLVTLKPTISFGNETNLVGFWQFEEGEGTVATDTSGKENNGTIVEPVWVTGKIGNALQFNGNSYVQIPHNAVLNPRNAITVEAWINPASNMQWRKIISKSLGGNTDYSFFQGDKSNIAFSIKMGSVAPPCTGLQTLYRLGNGPM